MLAGMTVVVVALIIAAVVIALPSGASPGDTSTTLTVVSSAAVASTFLNGVDSPEPTVTAVDESGEVPAAQGGTRTFRDSFRGFSFTYPSSWVRFPVDAMVGGQVPEGAGIAVGDADGANLRGMPVNCMVFVVIWEEIPESDTNDGQENGIHSAADALEASAARWMSALPAEAQTTIVEPARDFAVNGLEAAETTYRILTAEGRVMLVRMVIAGGDTESGSSACMLFMYSEESQRERYWPLFDQAVESLTLDGM
jgi:hypothetical protein